MDKEELKSNVSKPDIWVRGIHMLILFIALRISELILYGLIIFQYGMELITGAGTKIWTRSLRIYLCIKNIFLYLSFNEEQRPFPFAEWEDSIK